MAMGAEQLKVARRSLGWSQSKLASMASVSQTTIAAFESGGKAPAALAHVQTVMEAAGLAFGDDSPGQETASGERTARTGDEAALPDLPDAEGEKYDGSPI
jgi:transcriptional regulator with XRE-family HTH domain